MNTAPSRLPQQQGAALLVTLCVVLALMLLAASAMRSALNAERAARGERDRQVALQAAEAALEDAEYDIEGGANPQSERAAMFAPGSADGFVDGCGAGGDNPRLGLCAHMPEPGVPAWHSVALAGGDARAVEYGRFTGAAMPFGVGTLPARLPRYVIELMPHARAGHDASTRTGNFYRITAIGFGASDTTRVVLQSYYLKAGELA
jgi:type IV pilus assembly protein PilX